MHDLPHLHLVGEIIETCEHQGQRRIRIALQSLCIDLAIGPDVDASLGEVIVIDAGVAIHHIAPLQPEKADDLTPPETGGATSDGTRSILPT
jgi:hypothetical protein